MTRLSILAFSAILALAPCAMAQSTSSPSPPVQGSTPPAPSSPVLGQGATTQAPSPSAPEQGATPAKPDPQQHLADIQRRLDTVANLQLSPDGKQNADAKEKLAQLRDDFTKLVASYRHKVSARGPVTNPAGESPDPAFVDWNHKFSDVERDLVVILGGGSTLSPTSTTAVGTNAGGTTAVADSTGTVPAGSVGAPQAGQAGQPVQAAPGGAAATAGTPGVVNGAGAAGASTAATAGNSGVPTAQVPAGSPTPGVGSGGSGGLAANGAAGGAGLADLAVAGVAIKDIGIKNLDPKARAELVQVRISVELFYDAATRVGLP
jgi:hypothetical protein